jgi:hypothetical protein
MYSCIFNLPPISNSCPWEPINVFDKKGAKSTNISLNKGATDPNAFSNLSSVIFMQKYLIVVGIEDHDTSVNDASVTSTEQEQELEWDGSGEPQSQPISAISAGNHGHSKLERIF